MHALGRQRFRFCLYVHPAKNFTRRASDIGRTANPKAVAAADDVYAEPAFQLFQVLIERTADICQPFVVSGFQPYVVYGGEILLGLNAQLEYGNSSDGDWMRRNIHELPTKTVGQGFSDPHVRELTNEIMIR